MPLSLASKTAGFQFDQSFVKASEGSLETSFSLSTSYPFSSIAPPITIEFSMGICVSQNGEIRMRASGVNNAFPAYEVVVDDKVIYGRMPDNSDSIGGPSFGNLGHQYLGLMGLTVTYDTGYLKLY